MWQWQEEKNTIIFFACLSKKWGKYILGDWTKRVVFLSLFFIVYQIILDGRRTPEQTILSVHMIYYLLGDWMDTLEMMSDDDDMLWHVNAERYYFLCRIG